jgi:hypothetical protein
MSAEFWYLTPMAALLLGLLALAWQSEFLTRRSRRPPF